MPITTPDLTEAKIISRDSYVMDIAAIARSYDLHSVVIERSIATKSCRIPFVHPVPSSRSSKLGIGEFSVF